MNVTHKMKFFEITNFLKIIIFFLFHYAKKLSGYLTDTTNTTTNVTKPNIAAALFVIRKENKKSN